MGKLYGKSRSMAAALQGGAAAADPLYDSIYSDLKQVRLMLAWGIRAAD